MEETGERWTKLRFIGDAWPEGQDTEKNAGIYGSTPSRLRPSCGSPQYLLGQFGRRSGVIDLKCRFCWTLASGIDLNWTVLAMPHVSIKETVTMIDGMYDLLPIEYNFTPFLLDAYAIDD